LEFLFADKAVTPPHHFCLKRGESESPSRDLLRYCLHPTWSFRGKTLISQGEKPLSASQDFAVSADRLAAPKA
jgi:hypothetical protein